jgi:hypothetical protein
MRLRYDRRVPAELLEALGSSGFAHSLVQNARGGRGGLDLQLRGYAGKTPHWASLYVGLSKVIDFRYAAKRGFQLDADPFYKQSAHGWNPKWERWQTIKGLAADWVDVDAYLDRAFLRVDKRYSTREGSVQAAFSAFQSDDYAVFDREAAITFVNQTEKDAICRGLTKRLLAALEPGLVGAAWWKTAKALGGECDALAVHADGTLLAIEIKPANELAGTAWAPLQVTHYANLFRQWIQTDPEATEVVRSMLGQRVRLGLSPDLSSRLKEPLRVRPMIVIGKPVAENALDRMRQVQARLLERDVGYPDLEVIGVNLAGRPTRITI